MRSTSYTAPRQVPPLAACRAAHRRVSSGSAGLAAKSGWAARRWSSAAAAPASSARSAVPTISTRPSRPSRSTTISIRSPSRSLPIGPPANASGPMCPMQAPVDTPEKRASVSTDTVLPHGRNLSAEVIW